MKVLLCLFLLVSSTLSFARPGDVGCIGTSNANKVEVLLGYDYHGQKTPSVLWLSVNRKRVFEAQEIERRDGNSKMIITAYDQESTVSLNFNRRSQAMLTVTTDTGLFRVNNLKLLCE